MAGTGSEPGSGGAEGVCERQVDSLPRDFEVSLCISAPYSG